MDQQKKVPSSTLIYVSNLPFETNDEQLKELFKGFGVKTAYVAKRRNGNSKGFGFVNLEKESDQNAAIESVNGKEFNSRKLNAKVAMNDDRRNENGELREEFKTLTQNRSAPSETVVYVSNLEWNVNDESLKKIFAEFNPKVATVAIRRNGKSKGFGFVEFNTKEDQEKALKLDNSKVEGREIAVKASTGYRGDKPREQRKSNVRSVRRDNNNRDNSRRQERSFTLFVNNLPLELDDNDLKDIFQEFHPRNARIINGRNGNSKGYGFVEFNNSRDQNDALRALDQSEINDRVVTVKKSTSGNRDNNRRDNSRNNDNRRDNNRNNDNRRDNSRNNDNRRDNRNNDNRRDNRNNNDNRRDNNRNNDNRRNNNNTRPPRNENREISNTLVYVSNLPFNVDDKGLEEIFKGLKSNKAYITRRRNGYSKGFGFVEFASAEDQKKAVESNGTEIGGRKIVVQAAFKVDEKQQTTTNQN
eukprot:TRINITY_DN31_c0_g1_i5.p1 TRINITY_DN31_c0_g1~~TRINITY_DN31_c0_g1_i5.p1  ORF type:complete len:472 (+),score=209.11 TRINITY_DN31_c0_g1_i5:54-1469(+)